MLEDDKENMSLPQKVALANRKTYVVLMMVKVARLESTVLVVKKARSLIAKKGILGHSSLGIL